MINYISMGKISKKSDVFFDIYPHKKHIIMQKIATYLSVVYLSLTLFFVSCDKSEDVIPHGVVYVSNQIAPVNEYKFKNIFNLTENTSTLTGDSVYKFPARITMPATEKVTVKFDIDEDFIATYNEANGTQYSFLPPQFYTIEKNEVSIEQGETESKDSVLVRLNTKANWEEAKGALLLLPIKIVSATGKSVSISKNMNTVKVFGVLHKVLANIDSSNEPIEGVEFNDGITLTSNYKQGDMGFLTDGNIDSDGWYPTLPSHYITITLDKEQVIKGIKFNTSSSYQLSGVSLSSIGADGSFEQGVFSSNKVTTVVYLKFKTPVSVKSLTLNRFKARNGGNSPDLFEINLIK